MFRGALYRKYPSLWRKLATVDERKIIAQQCEYKNVYANFIEFFMCFAGLQKKQQKKP